VNKFAPCWQFSNSAEVGQSLVAGCCRGGRPATGQLEARTTTSDNSFIVLASLGPNRSSQAPAQSRGAGGLIRAGRDEQRGRGGPLVASLGPFVQWAGGRQNKSTAQMANAQLGGPVAIGVCQWCSSLCCSLGRLALELELELELAGQPAGGRATDAEMMDPD